MPLAKSYSPNPQAQKNSDVGPSPFQQMDRAFINAVVNPQLKVFQYTVLPAVKGLPIVGDAFHWFEILLDPINELKKDLNISPSISGAIGEAIVSHSVAGAAKVFAVGIGAAAGGQISNSLVQNAISYEWANYAMMAKRNPAKFFIQQVWNNVVKADWIFDRTIYDKTYLFYKAVDHKGERFARWRNNSLFEDFNRRAEKYGVKLEGAEQKFGAHSFTSVLEDKKEKIRVRDYFDQVTGQWVYKDVFKTAGHVLPLKIAKIGWQVAAPTVATAILFPPALPFVLGWQVINADWGQFVKKTPLIEIPDHIEKKDGSWARHKDGSFVNPIKEQMDQELSETGEFSGLKNHEGRWMKGGRKLYWHSTDPSKQMGDLDKVFQSLADFGTIRGWYRTFITGEALRERALSYSTEVLLDVRNGIHNHIYLGYDPKNPAKLGTVIKPNFREAGWEHVGFHKASKSNIYERVIKLSNGDIRVKLYKDATGIWRLANSFGRNTVANKFWWAAFQVQQFVKTVVKRFTVPAALILALPANPFSLLIYAYAGYSAFKGLGEIMEPLKWWGWKKEEFANRVQLIARFGKAGLHNIYISIEENGTSFFRRLSRFLYSVFSPFDRDVGILRGLLVWRDAQWGKTVNAFWHSGAGLRVRAVFIKYPAIRKFFDFASRIPGMNYLFKAGGFLLGGVKWVVAPGQAIKDALWDFGKWVTWKGFRWALGKAFNKWFARPVANWLTNWARSLPAGSIRRRIIRFFLGKSLRGLKPPIPKVPGLFGKVFQPIFDILKSLISQFIKQVVWKLIQFIWKLVWELIKTVTKAVLQIFQGIFDAVAAATSPVWGTVVVVALAIIAALILLALIIFILVILVTGFLSSAGVTNPYQSPPVSSYLEIRKELGSGGPTFSKGQTIDYKITYKIKKPMKSSIKFEDKFLISTTDASGTTKYLFDPDSLRCDTPANITANNFTPDPEGPSGYWKSIVGTVPYNDPEAGGPVWVEFHCFAKVANDPNAYTDGQLINHAIISGEKKDTTDQVAASQWLYVNGSTAAGWPVEHGCFTQGPNTHGLLSSHKSQEAVDIGSNRNLNPVFNIDAKPVKSTITGRTLRVCVDGTYTSNNSTGVCGGIDEGSHFSTGFGTYVIVKETSTNLSAFYAHLGPSGLVTEGQSVTKGSTIIGYVDNSGHDAFGKPTSNAPHLHYAFTKNSGARMNQPFIPYYVPSCSPDWPDTNCADAFASIGEPSRVCF